MKSSKPAPPRGFVLVAVLVALVVITLLASAVAVVSSRALAEAQAEADAFEGELAMIGTRDSVLYLLNTQRQTYGGLTVDEQVVWSVGQAIAIRPDDDFGDSTNFLPIGNEIKLDGTPYIGLGTARFALQDDAGRYSPNWTYPVYRDGFLRVLGVSPDEAEMLDARRLDYQDPDDLYRLNGAEHEQYRTKGLPPPPNRTFVTPLELRRVLGWDKVLAPLDDAELMALVTVARTVAINVNTAPAKALRSLPGVDEATAQRIIDLRARVPHMLPWQFIQTFNLPLDDMEPLGMLAVSYGTLKLWHNAGGPARMVHWTLTPTDEGGRPWRLDYEIALPRDHNADSDMARAPETPVFSQPRPPGR